MTTERAEAVCRNCEGAEWVCENHDDLPWGGVSASVIACHCGGAGMPCAVCNTEMAFAGRRAATIEACAAIAEAPFDWGLYEAPRTYRALAVRLAANIRALAALNKEQTP